MGAHGENVSLGMNRKLLRKDTGAALRQRQAEEAKARDDAAAAARRGGGGRPLAEAITIHETEQVLPETVKYQAGPLARVLGFGKGTAASPRYSGGGGGGARRGSRRGGGQRRSGAGASAASKLLRRTPPPPPPPPPPPAAAQAMREACRSRRWR